MNLSEHLTLAEAIRSESAKRLGINNMPTDEHIKNGRVLAENIHEPLRAYFRRPIHISSGYRSFNLNKAIGGSNSSQHSTFEAFDYDMDGTEVSNKDIFNYIKDNLPFDQLIWEFGNNESPAWVHVSHKANGVQRGQVLRAKKLNGKTIYERF